jgi:hypothetical protein
MDTKKQLIYGKILINGTLNQTNNQLSQTFDTIFKKCLLFEI